MKALRLAAIALLLAPLVAARADDVGDVGDAIEATRDLYSRISQRDRGVLRYVPADGIDELSTGSAEWHRLDARAFDQLFASDLRIALRAEDLRARSFGGVAVVTGTRVGSVTPPGQVAREARHPFTLVWKRVGGDWQLCHVHLSTATASTRGAP